MPDSSIRETALNLRQSYIVQAPAGSGKTELLTQRFLGLLTVVENPEEIIALTFTRKAAAEMRARILERLQLGLGVPPEQAHARRTYDLARQVLARDVEKTWHILQNPARLRVMTIDALCARLTQQMPTLSQCGAIPKICDDSQPLYHEAARQLLQRINDEDNSAAALKKLLYHLDNNHFKLTQLCVDMLGKREQWLPYILQARHHDQLRELLEDNLLQITLECLQNAYQAFPATLKDNCLAYARYAANNLALENPKDPITCLATLETFPTPDENHIPHWQALIALLLTQTGTIRKQVNKNIGFPAPSAADNLDEKACFTVYKQNMLAFLKLCAADGNLQTALAALQAAPPCTYDETQWQIIDALLELLPVLVAELSLIFNKHRQIDFIEMANRATIALGPDDAPTDLALHLDYVIQHLLVDEFQDTSHLQFRLLEKLTSGWEVNDGRTLFCVGDPMQSIYRFRQAQVGLFLHASDHGLGSIALIPLQLSSNFRSHPTIIAWINETFSRVLPTQPNMALGAIPYATAVAACPTEGRSYVSCTYQNTAENEARTILEIIACANPDSSIAILVRARTHLYELIQKLRAKHIPFQATELESLAAHPMVQDLWSLTRALLQTHDSTAWLSILRAPWCGLTLSALHQITEFCGTQPLWPTLDQETLISQLDPESQMRLQHVIRIMQLAQGNRMRVRFHALLQQTWRALGGPATANNPEDLEAASAYFELIQTLETAGDVHDSDALALKLTQLFAPSQTQTETRIQIMTMHKAKGLEFDIVICPALERQGAIDTAALLTWSERLDQYGEERLILAPIKSSDDQVDPIFQFLRLEDAQKNQFESARVLYVAATRAKKQLHLLSVIAADDIETYQPPRNSLLAHIWAVTREQWQPGPVYDNGRSEIPEQKTVQRFAASWYHHHNPLHYFTQRSANNPIPHTGFAWAPQTPAIVGDIIHTFLESIGRDGLDNWSINRLNDYQTYWQNTLRMRGVPEAHIKPQCAIITQALTNTLQSKHGRWILADHPQAAVEWGLTMNGQQYIIDRTFIDDTGTRWIIDYKTSQPNSDTLERYRPQLQQYALICRKMEERPIKTALYFPIPDLFCDIDCSHIETAAII